MLRNAALASNGTYYSDGQAAKLYLALVPGLKDVNAKTGRVQAPSVQRDNLIQLTDIAPTIAARYGQNRHWVLLVKHCRRLLGESTTRRP